MFGKLDMADLIEALKVMGKGMLGIFIALTVVYLFVLLLTKAFPADKEKAENEEEGKTQK